MIKKGISKPSKPKAREDEQPATISNNLLKMKFMQKSDKLKEIKIEAQQPSHLSYRNEFNIQDKNKW
jgi:hypothetical protein